MKASIFTLVISATCFFTFSSCQKSGFDRGPADDGVVIASQADLPCFNKDMDSHLAAANEIALSEATLVQLHLYSCDSLLLREIQWTFPEGSLVKYTGEENNILISFEDVGEKTISVAIIYQDTELDEDGNHIGGTAPKIITKKIKVSDSQVVACANRDKDSHLISEDQVLVKQQLNVRLHLYSCDALNMKEIRWNAKYAELNFPKETNEVNLTYFDPGAFEVEATIIYKDTVLDRGGQYVSGTRPKLVSKTINVVVGPGI